MKYNDTIRILNNLVKAIIDPTLLTNKGWRSESFQVSNNPAINNSLYKEDKNSNPQGTPSGCKEINESVPREDNKAYNDNTSNDYYTKQQEASSSPQGKIDSITQEITPVRLQQAIILSEIVGKPRSKTRKRRRF
jgi:hypothetical protein